MSQPPTPDDDHTATLVASRPAAPAPPDVTISIAAGPPPRAQSSLTTAAAVREEQEARGGAMIRVGFGVSLVALIALQLPANQHPTGKLIATVALAVVCASSLFAILMEGSGRRLSTRDIFYLSLIVTPSIVVVAGHVGVMSPTCFAFIFGIYYFGLSDDKVEGWVTIGIASIGYAVITALTVAGVTPVESALFSLANSDPIAIGAMAVVVELMFFATFWLARLSRAATVQAMWRLEHARQQIQQRDALLAEANQDLQQALGGSRGRFTGELIGQFVVGSVIGRGAMGEVYRARHQSTDDSAAVKVMHGYMLESHVNVERFFREAEVTSSLRSEHIVRVLGHGVLDDRSPYLVMELLEGHDLGWHLRERRRFAIKDAVHIVADIAEGLNAAQDAGIVHRDIKPKNVLYDERAACWKVLDFGVSKIRASSGTLTHGDIVGTPGYMAPEQATSDPVDHRADVFSLGVIAYRLVTGAPAFSGNDPLSTMYQVASRQPKQPSRQAPLPEDMDLVLALALAKSPERRFRSASAFSAAFRDASREDLDGRFRDDARTLLREQPWGQSLS